MRALRTHLVVGYLVQQLQKHRSHVPAHGFYTPIQEITQFRQRLPEQAVVAFPQIEDDGV
jgi:hypothetical protein